MHQWKIPGGEGRVKVVEIPIYYTKIWGKSVDFQGDQRKKKMGFSQSATEKTCTIVNSLYTCTVPFKAQQYVGEHTLLYKKEM